MSHFDFGRQRLMGLVPAVVKQVDDSRGQARVLVDFPWVDDADSNQARVWARLSTMMAGANRGTYFVPEPGDEVIVGFVHGDPRFPIVLGALWNGADAPPETMDAAGKNDVRSVTSRSGHQLRFVDAAGGERIELLSQGGHRVVLDDADRSITIEASNGAVIEIDTAGKVSVRAVTKVSVDAPAGVDVTAPIVNVDAPISKFSGIVKAETVITNSVISASYTPGAGNVW